MARSSLLKGYELELAFTKGVIDANPAKNFLKYLINILIDFIVKLWNLLKEAGRIRAKN
jgi:hypothetical protein